MVTIIIPTYNNESTIERAIQSVITQTYQDWYLIIINDASTDKTSDIINNYALMFPHKIKILNNSVNYGVGISRKIAVDYCNSEFLTFLDSDDMLTPDYIQKSLDIQKQQNADIVYTGFNIIFPGSGKNDMKNYGDEVLLGKDTIKPYFSQELKFLTGKLIKTSIMKSTKMSPKRIGEDTQTLFYALYKSNIVRVNPFAGYIHIVRINSLLSDVTYFYRWTNSTIVDQEIMDFLIENNDEKYLKTILKNAFNEYIITMEQMHHEEIIPQKDINDNIQYWKQVDEWFNKHMEYILKFGIGGIGQMGIKFNS